MHPKKTPDVPAKPAPQPDVPPALSADCRSILAMIPDDRAVSSDALMVAGIPPAALTVALIELELAGLIESLPGNLYIRTDD